MQSYNGIVFDMDGVLADTEESYYDRRKAFLTQWGLNIDHLPKQFFVGGNMHQVMDVLLKGTAIDAAELLVAYEAYKTEHPVAYAELVDPEAKKVLQFLKRAGYKVGLASSSTKQMIEQMLTETQLASYFDVVVSGEDFKESKPHPEIYQHTVAELGLTPTECVAIEDSPKGIQSARAAGLTVWAKKDQVFGLNQSAADLQIDSLSDICRQLSV